MKYCRVKNGLNKHNPTKIEIGKPLVTNRKDYAVIVTSLLPNLPNQPCNSLSVKECWQYCEFTNGNGCTDTAGHALTVAICEGIQPVSNGAAYNVYPNPATSNLYISFNSAKAGEQVQETITDITGRVVSESVQTVGNKLMNVLDVSTLSSGMYFLNIMGNQHSETFKFIKE